MTGAEPMLGVWYSRCVIYVFSTVLLKIESDTVFIVRVLYSSSDISARIAEE